MEKKIKKAKGAVIENLGATHFTILNQAASNALVVYRRITRHDFRVRRQGNTLSWRLPRDFRGIFIQDIRLLHEMVSVKGSYILLDNIKIQHIKYNKIPTNAIYSGVCYNERCYNEQLLSIKSGCYNEYRCYNERGGILSADVARSCA